MKITFRLIGKVIGIIVAIVLILGLAVYFIPIFRVSSIEVTGNSHITSEELENAADVPEGANLLRINAHDVAANVVSLPWVATATVRRSLPSTLNVEITERTAVGFVNADDGPHLIDGNGHEFIIDEPPENAVEITGEWTPETLSDPAEVIVSIPDEIRVNIDHLEVEEPYVLRIFMKDGRSIVWGANEDNKNKARALSTVLQMEGDNWNISNPALVSRP